MQPEIVLQPVGGQIFDVNKVALYEGVNLFEVRIHYGYSEPLGLITHEQELTYLLQAASEDIACELARTAILPEILGNHQRASAHIHARPAQILTASNT